MAQVRWNIGEKPKEILEHVALDHGWTQHLPAGYTAIATAGHGASFWSQTARIDVTYGRDEVKSFFLKLTPVKPMVEGEFESMKDLHQVSPEITPAPIAYGTFETDPSIHFFLCEFIDLYDSLPDVVDFPRDIADLHRKSIDLNKTGEFGFQVTTLNGTVPQKNDWNISWEAFFIEALKDAFKQEVESHGVCEEYDILLPTFFEKVCPALLRPLETDGRTLKPCLVHGDLWDGNVAVNADTSRAYIYDASAMWAHNEYELAIWRHPRYRIRGVYVEEYFKNFPQSPPAEDWDDCNLLYSVRTDLHSSILFPSTKNFREMILETLRHLNKKYSAGYTGTAERKDTALRRMEQGGLGSVEGGGGTMPSGSQVPPHRSDLREQINAPTESDENAMPSGPSSSVVDTRSDVAFGESAVTPRTASVVGEA